MAEYRWCFVISSPALEFKVLMAVATFQMLARVTLPLARRRSLMKEASSVRLSVNDLSVSYFPKTLSTYCLICWSVITIMAINLPLPLLNMYIYPMSQVIINRGLTDKEIYSKISSRMDKIKDRLVTASDYFHSAQLALQVQFKHTRKAYEEFQQSAQKSCFYADLRCLHVVAHLSRLKDQFKGLEKSAILNVIRLQKHNGCHTPKAHSAVKKQIDRFYNCLRQYAAKSAKIQHKTKLYQEQVDYLKESISKYELLNDPVRFYNPSEIKKQLAEFDLKYKSLQEKESDLRGQVSLMQVQKACLQTDMKDLKDSTIQMLTTNSDSLNDMVNIIVEGCRERTDGGNQNQMVLDSDVTDLLYTSELSSMKGIYNKLQQVNLDGSFQNPFPKQVDVGLMNPDLKLYAQRCKNLILLRSRCLQESLDFIQSVKTLIAKLLSVGLSLKQNYKRAIAKTFGPSGNNIEKFKKDLWRYLGQRSINLFSIAQLIISRQSVASSNACKRLAPIIKGFAGKTEEGAMILKYFQEKSRLILTAHNQIKQRVELQSAISQQLLEEYKSSIGKSFRDLTQLMQSINEKEDTVYLFVNQNVAQLVSTWCNQIQHSSLQKICNQHPELAEALRVKHTEADILEIMNNDQRYQVLFNFFFYQVISKATVKSSIREEYSKVRDLLEKNDHINQIATKFVTKTAPIGCLAGKGNLGLSPTLTSKCMLLSSSKSVPGTLQIYPDCITFRKDPTFLKGGKLVLIVPKIGFIGINKRIITQTSQYTLELVTVMGVLVFQEVTHHSEAYSLISKLCQSLIKRTDSKSSLQLGRGKSIVRNLSTSSAFGDLSSKNYTKKIGQQTFTGTPLRQRSEAEGYLLDLAGLPHGFQGFKLISQSNSENKIKRVFQLNLFKIQFTLKQARLIRQEKKRFEISIRWELKSKTHSFGLQEHIVGEIQLGKVSVYIRLSNVPFLQSYVEGEFKEHVYSMNNFLCEKVSELLRLQCEVHFEEFVSTQLQIKEDGPSDAHNRSGGGGHNAKQKIPNPFVQLGTPQLAVKEMPIPSGSKHVWNYGIQASHKDRWGSNWISNNVDSQRQQ